MVNIVYFDAKFRDSWLTKDFEKIIMQYVQPYDSILFLCAGKFRLKPSLVPFEAYYLDADSSVIADIDKEHKYILDAFREDLPRLVGRTFDVVVADPPYYIAHNKKFHFVFNLRRLARRVIIVKWNIIPRLGDEWELKGIYIYEGKRWWTYASIITVFTKK